jgi:hypothetical protein
MHQHARLFPTTASPPPLLPPYHSPTAGGNNSLLHEGGAEFYHRTGHVGAQQQQQQQQQVGGGHLSAVGDREQRYRYHLYERESAWAEVEKLSGYISRCAVAELASSVDITKEKYYDLFNIGVHLLKAIEALDPDRAFKSESYDSPPQQRAQADVGRTSPTYGMQRQSSTAAPTTTTTTTTTMTSSGTTVNGPSFPTGQVNRSVSTQPTYSSPSDSNFPNNPARSYSSEAGPGKGLPPPPPIGGIARYNQSIVSGMLSMGQPTGQPPPMSSYKQLSSDVGAPLAESSSLPPGTSWEPPGNSSTTTTSGRKKRQRKVKRRDLHCHVCGVTDTPEWRRGPDGDHTLCNACGLHYAKALKKEREAREKEGRKHSIDMLLNQQGTTKPNEPPTTPLVVERQ